MYIRGERGGLFKVLSFGEDFGEVAVRTCDILT